MAVHTHRSIVFLFKVMASPNSNDAPPYWAYDSNNNELDPLLKPAHRVAVQDHADPPCRSWLEAEQTEPLLLRNLLSADQIDEILERVSEGGVWPRGSKDCTGEDADSSKSSSSKKIKNHFNRPGLCDELKSVAHHLAWTDDHVVLYMHTDDWFVNTLPECWSKIRGAMESRPWMNGSVPVLDDAWMGFANTMEHVRCIELHHYSAGGGLLTPGHRDTGSALTISVLLSDPDTVTGGDFVTYNEGMPVAHLMARGDAILFNSESLHNISSVNSGLRQSLVVELWPSGGPISQDW